MTWRETTSQIQILQDSIIEQSHTKVGIETLSVPFYSWNSSGRSIGEFSSFSMQAGYSFSRATSTWAVWQRFRRFSSRSSGCFGPYRMLLLCPDGQKPLLVKAETLEPLDLHLDRTNAHPETR